MQKAWSGVKPIVNHLRICGSVAYVYVSDQRRSKPNDQSVKHVFIAYDANSKGCRLYNPSNGKIVVSHNMKFDEEATWIWEANEESTYYFFPYFGEEDQELVTPI